MSRYAPTPEVMAIGQINISGNVTPANWWKYIRLSQFEILVKEFTA